MSRNRASAGRGPSCAAVVAALVLPCSVAVAQPPQAPEAARPGQEPAETEAKARFFKGLELFAAKDWGAALAEFERSRQLHPTRGATRNAAICLKNLRRYDDAVMLYEQWRRTWPDAPEDERKLVEAELAALAELVGSLTITVNEVGATVFVDGVERGRSPLDAPLRVSAGAHVVHVYKDGYVAAQVSTTVAGAAAAAVEIALRPLAQSGRLRVRVLDGRRADVRIDGIKVGEAPWEGALPVGEHAIELVAEGELGSQPATAPVKLGEITSVTLELEPVPATLTVTTSPPGALIALDGVSVGRGSFRGRARLGRHRVEVALEGYLPATRTVTFDEAGSKALSVALERDRTSPLWGSAPQPRFEVAARLGPVIGPSLFGEVSSRGCEDGCDATPSYGALGLVGLGYRWPLGVTAGVDLGYLGLFQRVVDREAVLFERPDALRRDRGRADDSLALQGLVAGPSLGVDGGDRVVWRTHLFTGVFVANAADRRIGRFAPESGGVGYATAPYGENHRALSLAIIPEVHIGAKIAAGWEIGAGLAPILLIGLDEPAWSNERDVLGPDFLGYYETERLVGDVVFALSPTLGLTGLF